MSLNLARTLDDGAGLATAAVNRELRANLLELSRLAVNDTDDLDDELSTPSCPPRFGTARNPDRPTLGPATGAVAPKLGKPFMPWQRDAAMVGCEIDPETGRPAYRKVLITVPRQQGKTTLFLSWQINRCLSPRWVQPQRSAFTAQSGKDARDKWLDELFPLIRRSRALRPGPG